MTMKVKKSVAGQFQALHDRLHEWLLPIARKICRGADEFDPDDLVQETLARCLESYKPRGQPGDPPIDNWLITVMTRYFYDERKKSLSRQKAEQDPTLARWTLGEEGISSTYERITRERFDWAISKLPEQQRVTYLLRSQKLRNQEIALKLGVPVNVVAKRLFDARKNLRQLLQPYVEEGSH